MASTSSIYPGEVVGLVGESGSGKSVTALSVLRLIPDPPGRIVAGEIIFKGRDLLKLDDEGIRDVRGDEISMIFQEPMTSLNPVFTIGMQLMEVYLQHEKISKKEAFNRSVEMLRLVGIADAPAAHEAVPASVFRRAAAADHDRDGAGIDARSADRRRADDGARRDDSGADSGSDARDEGCGRRTRRSC